MHPPGYPSGGSPGGSGYPLEVPPGRPHCFVITKEVLILCEHLKSLFSNLIYIIYFNFFYTNCQIDWANSRCNCWIQGGLVELLKRVHLLLMILASWWSNLTKIRPSRNQNHETPLLVHSSTIGLQNLSLHVQCMNTYKKHHHDHLGDMGCSGAPASHRQCATMCQISYNVEAYDMIYLTPELLQMDCHTFV